MRTLITILVSLFITHPLLATNEASPEELFREVQTVYNELTDKAGYSVLSSQFGEKKRRPEIRMIEDRDEYGFCYSPGSNAIEVEINTLRMCNEVLGEDFSKGIAFLLGHELTHFYLDHGHGGFLMHPDFLFSHEEEEMEADINGALLALIAGYDAETVIPKLIEAIYTKHGLKDKEKGYPHKQARMEVAYGALDRFKELKAMYHTARYLSASGDYYFAGLLYNELKSSLNCKELNNNLAANYLVAVSVGAPTYWQAEKYFAFPVELDARSVSFDRSADFDREDLLKLAETSLEHCLELDPSFFSAHLNLITCYILQKEWAKAWSYIAEIKATMKLQADQLASLDIQESILYSFEENVSMARKKLREAANRAPNNLAISTWVQENERVLNGHIEDDHTILPEIEENLGVIRRQEKPEFSFSRSAGSNFLDRTKLSFEVSPRLTHFLAINEGNREVQIELFILKGYQTTHQGASRGNTQTQVLDAYHNIPLRTVKDNSSDVGSFIVLDHRGLIFRINRAGNVEEWALVR